MSEQVFCDDCMDLKSLKEQNAALRSCLRTVVHWHPLSCPASLIDRAKEILEKSE